MSSDAMTTLFHVSDTHFGVEDRAAMVAYLDSLDD